MSKEIELRTKITSIKIMDGVLDPEILACLDTLIRGDTELSTKLCALLKYEELITALPTTSESGFYPLESYIELIHKDLERRNRQ